VTLSSVPNGDERGAAMFANHFNPEIGSAIMTEKLFLVEFNRTTFQK
jgi:hypothetical protein